MEEAAEIEFQQQVKGAYSTQVKGAYSTQVKGAYSTVDHAWLQYWYVSTYLLMCSSAVATEERGLLRWWR